MLILTKTKREGFRSNSNRDTGHLVVFLYYWGATVCFPMSQFQIKNLQRRLDNLATEATHELNKACGHDLWRNIGFDAFDGLQDSERREMANYYYGQWQTVKELQDSLS